MENDRKALLQERLQQLAPTLLDITDESHLHAGHAGSRDGASHFRVHIWCAAFAGLGMVARHRLVYSQVADLMPYPIHALAIIAREPS